MVDNIIKTELLKRHGEYDFNELVKFIENTGFEYKSVGLRGPLGISTLDNIMLDIDSINNVGNMFGDKFIFYIILHETAHFKRIQKLGRNEMLGRLSNSNYNRFLDHVFEEEVIADRYATRLFYRFNKRIYPWSETQELNLIENQEIYETFARSYYGKINNDEELYTELINKFIIND